MRRFDLPPPDGSRAVSPTVTDASLSGASPLPLLIVIAGLDQLSPELTGIRACPLPDGFSVTRKTALAVSGSSPPFFRLSPFLKNVKAARKPPSRLDFPDFLKVGSLIA